MDVFETLQILRQSNQIETTLLNGSNGKGDCGQYLTL